MNLYMKKLMCMFLVFVICRHVDDSTSGFDVTFSI